MLGTTTTLEPKKVEIDIVPCFFPSSSLDVSESSLALQSLYFVYLLSRTGGLRWTFSIGFRTLSFYEGHNNREISTGRFGYYMERSESIAGRSILLIGLGIGSTGKEKDLITLVP